MGDVATMSTVTVPVGLLCSQTVWVWEGERNGMERLQFEELPKAFTVTLSRACFYWRCIASSTSTNLPSHPVRVVGKMLEAGMLGQSAILHGGVVPVHGGVIRVINCES